MKKSSGRTIKPDKKNFEYQFTLFRNLSKSICYSLEDLVELFETFSEPQRNQLLKEVENTTQNIFFVNELLNKENKIGENR